MYTKAGKVDVVRLIVQHIRRTGVRLAEVLGNVAFGYWRDAIIIEDKPGPASLDDRDVMAVMRAAEQRYQQMHMIDL